MKRFRSRQQISRKARSFALILASVTAVVLSASPASAALVTTDRYIVSEDQTVEEDQYIMSTAVWIEGVVDGNVTIFSGDVVISGEVTGSVTLTSFATLYVTEGAHIGGSIQGAASRVTVSGAVDGDLFITAGSLMVHGPATIGRDVISFGATTSIDGHVGRNVAGRMYSLIVYGDVGGDVDVTSQNVQLTNTATVGGDVLYRSSSNASIHSDARIAGTVSHLPAQGNFIYGVMLTIANIVGFFGFIIAGMASIWVMRSSSSRSVGIMLTRPLAALGVGVLATLLFVPVIVGLAMTLVGLPLAVVALMLAGVAFVVGAVPAVTALGNRILFDRGGLFGAFVLGAIIWRLGIWLVPYIGGYLFVLGVVWGIGAWAMGLVATRRGDPTPASLLPAVMTPTDEVPAGWEPPLAPESEEA